MGSHSSSSVNGGGVWEYCFARRANIQYAVLGSEGGLGYEHRDERSRGHCFLC